MINIEIWIKQSLLDILILVSLELGFNYADHSDQS